MIGKKRDGPVLQHPCPHHSKGATGSHAHAPRIPTENRPHCFPSKSRPGYKHQGPPPPPHFQKHHRSWGREQFHNRIWSTNIGLDRVCGAEPPSCPSPSVTRRALPWMASINTYLHSNTSVNRVTVLCMLRYLGKQGAEVKEGCVPTELPLFRPGCDQTQILSRSLQPDACSFSSFACLAAWQRRSNSRNPNRRKISPAGQSASLPSPSRYGGMDTIGGIPPQTISPHRTPDGRKKWVGNPGKKHAFFLESWGGGTSALSSSTVGRKLPVSPKG